jgi:hypothetical protein
MSLDLSTNHLAFAPVLKARLQTLTNLAVGGVAELDAALREGVTTASVFYVFGGTDTLASPGDRIRRPRIISQTWEIDLLFPLPLADDDIMADVGATLADVLDLLDGWQPAGAINQLQPIPIEEPVIYAGGLVRFVLAYRIDLNLT